MNPAGELVGLAARRLVARGTQVAGLAGSSAWAVLGPLSRSLRTVARPAGLRGMALGHLSLPVDSRAVRLVANALASPREGRWPI